jgi:phosphoribosylformylglycinamidine (FGAM) synthase PurS component
MRRPKSHDRRYKKSIWTQNQKLQAVSTYLMLGNLAETAVVTGVPLPTLKMWKTTDWFKEYALQLQSEDVQQMSSNLKKVVEKSLKAVEDRLDLGDAQFDQRTGAIVRVPVKAHVALKITTDLMTKQEKLLANPVKEQVEKTIDDRLLKLSEEFAKFASAKIGKSVPVDVEVKEIV